MNPTLIAGPQGSGKTRKAEELASKYAKDEVVWISYNPRTRLNSKSFYKDCTDKTKLIIIEGMWNGEQIMKVANHIKDGVVINSKMKSFLSLHPEFILTMQHAFPNKNYGPDAIVTKLNIVKVNPTNSVKLGLSPIFTYLPTKQK